MILILILAFIVLMPLALWHDWIDNFEAKNPELGHNIRYGVAYGVAILFAIWFLSNVTFY